MEYGLLGHITQRPRLENETRCKRGQSPGILSVAADLQSAKTNFFYVQASKTELPANWAQHKKQPSPPSFVLDLELHPAADCGLLDRTPREAPLNYKHVDAIHLRTIALKSGMGAPSPSSAFSSLDLATPGVATAFVWLSAVDVSKVCTKSE
jgi:hypothetical protein